MVVPSKTVRYRHAVVFATLWVAGVAHAQLLPPSADPGRMEKPVFPEVPTYDLKPLPSPQAAEEALPTEDEGQPFLLQSVTVKGAKAFTSEELESFYAPLLHQRVTPREVQAIVEAIQKHYMEAGFTISKVRLGQNNPTDGVVTIEVLEGCVAQVLVDPALAPSALIDGVVEQIISMCPLNTQQLERLMLILNSAPNLQVAAILEPPDDHGDNAGAMKLNLRKVGEARRHSFVSVDNGGSRFTGPVQIKAGTSIGGVASPYDDLALSGAVTNDMRELRQVAAEYTLPLWGVEGATLHASSSYSKTVPGYKLDALDVEGEALNLGVKVDYPIVLQRDRNWFVSAAFDYKNIATDMLGARLFNDQLRVATLSSRYARSDSYHGTTQLQGGISQGLDILGARVTGSPDLSRRDGHSDFTKAELSLSRQQYFGERLSVMAVGRGQYAWDPLLSSEEFGFGGEGGGRGYDPSEIAGDHGVAATVEARYAHAVNENWSVQPYMFYEVGRIWNIDPNDKKTVAAASAGAGVRVNTVLGLSVDANCATPLTKAAENPAGYANGNSPRFFINIRKLF